MKYSLLWFTLALYGLGLPSLFASSLASKSVSELSKDSHHIFRVKVQSKETVQHNHFPFSQVNAEVLETFKGRGVFEGEGISFHIPGGKRNEKAIRVSGVPEFESSNEYIVFIENRKLAEKDEGINRLTGWMAYQVFEKQEGERSVRSVGSAARVSSSSQRGLHIRHRAKPRGERSYQDFVSEIYEKAH